MRIEPTPRWPHDCQDCVFIGQLHDSEHIYDIYRCPQGGHPTIVARYGEYGDYYSGQTFKLGTSGIWLGVTDTDKT